MELDRATFERLRRSIHRICGLAIPDGKEYLIRDRLEPIVRQHRWSSFSKLADQLEDLRGWGAANEVTEAIVTRETSFFRDPHVWKVLGRSIMPDLMKGPLSHRPCAKFWSAAASTGQEAYSIAMLAREIDEAASVVRPLGNSASIMATDICQSAIKFGGAADFTQRELDRGLSKARQRRFFAPTERGMRVCDSLRPMVGFSQLNLAEKLPNWSPFDVIFCRNVLIYFDDATRRALCDQFFDRLKRGGWLVLGAAENLYGISNRFESVQMDGVLFYRRP